MEKLNVVDLGFKPDSLYNFAKVEMKKSTRFSIPDEWDSKSTSPHSLDVPLRTTRCSSGVPSFAVGRHIVFRRRCRTCHLAVSSPAVMSVALARMSVFTSLENRLAPRIVRCPKKRSPNQRNKGVLHSDRQENHAAYFSEGSRTCPDWHSSFREGQVRMNKDFRGLDIIDMIDDFLKATLNGNGRPECDFAVTIVFLRDPSSGNGHQQSHLASLMENDGQISG